MDENIVRSQGKNTFILTDSGTVDCSGQPYTVDEKVPVGIAHPMELDSSTVRAWQDYLVKNGIRQPFEQMWEIITDPKTIAADRYNGLMIPFMFFKGAAKHGIEVKSEREFDHRRWENIYSMWIKFKGCNVELDYDESDNGYIENDAKINVKSFKFGEYTRQVNHIVYLLDKWTFVGRILKNDGTFADMLDQFTLAQILDFIDISTRNECVNSTSVLLNYRNEHYPEYDGFAALDDLLLDDDF